MRVLWVATKCPWPPDDGGRLVARNAIEALARGGDSIEVVCPRAGGSVARPPLGIVLHAAAGARGLAPAAAFLRGAPAAVARHASRAMERHVAQRIRVDRPDAVVAEQLQALAACRPAFDAGIPVVLRAQNVETDLFVARAELAGGVAALLLRPEAVRLGAWEAAAVRRCAATLTLTVRDAQRLRALAGPAAPVEAIPAPFPADLPAGGPLGGDPAVVLFGSAGWWANADGVRWFVRNVWPAVAVRCPGARLHAFGFRIGRGVERAEEHPAPRDSREAFPSGGVFAVPLRAASGVRMKILEAWARGVPVVATPAAAAGLEAEDAVRIAADAEEFAAAIEGLASRDDATKLVEGGRAALARFHDPGAVAERLRGVLRAAAGGVRSRDYAPPAAIADSRSAT